MTALWGPPIPQLAGVPQTSLIPLFHHYFSGGLPQPVAQGRGRNKPKKKPQICVVHHLAGRG